MLCQLAAWPSKVENRCKMCFRRYRNFSFVDFMLLGRFHRSLLPSVPLLDNIIMLACMYICMIYSDI